MEETMEIGKKLRDNKMYADTVGMWVKYNYFDKVSRQEKLDYSVSTDEEIYDNAIRIFNKLWNRDNGIRSICVFVSGLSNSRKKQLSLFDVEDNGTHIIEKKKENLQNVIDNMRNKYGSDIIKYGGSK